MKNLFYLISLSLLLSFSASAQVLMDHQLQFTGSGSNAKVTNIQQVSANQDAVSVDYLQRDSLQFAIATGAGSSGNPYIVSLSPAVTTKYTVGMIVHFQAPSANAVTTYLAVNSLSAKLIKKNYNYDLASGDIQSGQMVSVIYDGTYFQMLSQLGNPAGAHGKKLFKYTGSSQTFTVPGGVSTVWVSMSGGGGGGGYGSGAGNGGGGAGAVMDSMLTLTLSSYTITVGNGGSGSTSSGSAGGLGGSSSFGSLLSVTGGNGGNSGTSNTGTGGSPGGINGNIGSQYAAQIGANGGGSLFGGGGNGSFFNDQGGNGSGYGGGGGGGNGSYSTYGGNGSPGFVLVEW